MSPFFFFFCIGLYLCPVEEKLNDIPFILSTLYEELNSLRNKFSIVAKEKKTLLKELSSKDRLLGLKDQEIKRLTGENLKLQKKLSSFELPVKNSHNSSIPGSKNPIASAQILRTRSLRGKSDLPTGGQPGHAGHTLEYCSHPDVIQTHVCEYCRHCGSSLSDIPYTEQGARQVIDLPAIVPVVTEHRIYSRECTCGHINKADFPVDVRSRISYGPRIQAFISYTNTVQCIPYKRLCQLLEECFHLKLSQGTVDNILQQIRRKSSPAYGEIRSRIARSQVVGADETGVSINGKGWWTWVWQNKKLTYVYQSPSRGKTAIYKEFPEGLPKATLVTDRHSSYFCIPVKEHQICLAHLLRELNYLSELNKKQTWSQRFLELLRDAIRQRKTKKWENIPRQEFEQKLDELLNEPLWQYQKEFWGFRKALARKKDYIFKFLYDPDVPYDNNASESAIRIIKTKLKVCGCFRSEKGADTFMQLHSIVDTAKKNQISRYKTLLAIAKMPAEDHCTPKEQPE